MKVEILANEGGENFFFNNVPFLKTDVPILNRGYNCLRTWTTTNPRNMVLAFEKRDSMHLSVPTLHRNKVKDSCFLQDARIPMTIFLHRLPWDLHLPSACLLPKKHPIPFYLDLDSKVVTNYLDHS